MINFGRHLKQGHGVMLQNLSMLSAKNESSKKVIE